MVESYKGTTSGITLNIWNTLLLHRATHKS